MINIVTDFFEASNIFKVKYNFKSTIYFGGMYVTKEMQTCNIYIYIYSAYSQNM